ncbi:hypothetical protein EGW08_020725, partial [Elysia chlorotica]
ATRDKIIKFSVQQGQKIRSILEEREGKVEKEKVVRLKEVARKKDTAQRRKMEKQVKEALEKDEGIEETLFESLGEDEKSFVRLVLCSSTDVIGKCVRHVWEVDGGNEEFCGTIKRYHKKNKRQMIIMSYEGYNDEFTISVTEFITDMLMGDISLF